MRKHLISIIVAIPLTFTLLGQSTSSLFPNITEKKEKEHFFINTFLLGAEELPLLTTINANYLMQEGNFYSPLTIGEYKGAHLKIASILSYSRWKLYGAFHYHNIFSEHSKAILSPVIQNNNPLYLLQKKSTPWHSLLYEFRTIASRNIFSPSTYMGVKFYYQGASFYKKTDLRNNQNLLKLTSGISIGHQINKKTRLGVDFNFIWNKSKPKISSIYTHAIDNKEYKHYMNVGFGTLIKNPGFLFQILTTTPSASFIATYQNHNSNHTFRLKPSFSRTIWKDEQIKDTKLFNKPYKYEQKKIEAAYTFSSKRPSHSWTSLYSISYYQGKSFLREEKQIKYRDVYWDKQFYTDYTLRRTTPKSFFEVIEVKTHLLSRKMRDKNYGNQLNYTSWENTIETVINFQPKTRKGLKLGLGIGYNMLLNKKQEQRTTFTNNFMEIIGNDMVSFLTTEHLKFNTRISYASKGKRQLLFFIQNNYIHPIEKDNFQSKSFNYKLNAGVILTY